ncbi:polyketide synthase [Aspergillus novofumigatus IBT 16806]|uniref:Non-reducing polyketide synthase nvfA n=1 Tax=Aspergillus novofumigatus (strain IBT 16806) TaxID=1392255 RepID=NVFA_ASPN1|nr:polyketide synthase [Aspergillus novofumigatus IBT 16806]A0A2I1BSV9.1 RecName: Full=Non-reducing polyketide synthase nvfA; AltName: Full=Novofumigatonin biosynthesis cluster protein A [Aspergillus novofumigatus IBT 16806]PKX88487.1 polyketide synthase [Aspergillus novofumigatus IBT 16806]
MEPSDTERCDVGILFGPQSSDMDEALSCIRSYVLEQPAVRYLVDLVLELPSLWPEIKNAWPALSQVPGEEQLVALGRFFNGGPFPASDEAMNVITTPVTVIRHIVEFYKVKETMKGFQARDVQGFCVGFLAATAVAASCDETAFRALVSKIIRLAVCIGGLVDLDELAVHRARSMAVRWDGEEDYDRLEQVLAAHPEAYIACVTDANRATLTVPKSLAPQMIQDLANHGLSVREIRLCGRFHHPDHTAAVEQMSRLCERDCRFQLPDASSLSLPLRSNINGEVIRTGQLHTIALQSILCFRSQWLITVTAALASITMTDESIRLVSIGPHQCVPRMAQSKLIRTVTSSPVDGCYEAINGTGAAPVRPIAVTGMACRYPQANSVEELWEMLELGKCAVKPLPNDRLKMVELLREPKGPYWGHYLEEPDMFDHRFFGISAREAATMDPQQRLLLQVAYEAMESAGYCGLRSSQIPRDVGCYVGVGSDDYTDNVGSHHANAYSAPGTLQAFNTGRISHYFGWSGPSVVVDTACSSAAVAIHLACQALRTKDCSVAIAGGVNVMTSPKVTQNLAAASFLSPTGASKAFDADADGYCRGEGAGLVVLRPLEDAISDVDPILAVITGTAVNQGSNCSPITVPVSESQMSLYGKSLAASGIAPEDVTYVEAHGTGTQVGDPIEFDSIRRMFGGRHRSEELYVGSIKDNIGHTETSSGVAGLVKTILMMQKGRIPKQANFSRLNPKIPAPEGDRIVIPKQSTDWKSARRVAMVTNYGAAGSNAAIVLRQHTITTNTGSSWLSDVPVFVAAKSPESLRSYCYKMQAFLRQTAGLLGCTMRDITYNLAIKQNRDLDFLVSFPTPSQDPMTLLSQLESVAAGVTDLQQRPAQAPSVILCFGGQNGNTAHISQDLFAGCHLLQAHLADCEKICQSMGLPSLFPTIFQEEPIHDLVNLHCILFAIQYASAMCWIHSGLQVKRMLGHSFGQLTALCVAGGLTLIDAIRLVSERARLIETSWAGDHGVMLSVDASEAEVRALVNRAGDTVDLACYNGARSYVLAGDEISIQVVEKLADGMRIKRLPNTHAFHSRLVDSIVPGLRKLAQSLKYHPTTIPVEACSEDGSAWTCVTPDQIVAHSRMPVHFDSAVQRAANHVQGPVVWLEAGSASPIVSMVRRVVEESSSSRAHLYQASDLKSPQAQANLAKATSGLWANGIPTSHWTEYDPLAFLPASAPIAEASSEPMGLVQVLEKRPSECLFSVNTKDPLYRTCTQGHAVVEQNLCPASLYLEMVVSAAGCLSSAGLITAMPHLQELSISAPLVLEPDGDVLLRLSQSPAEKTAWTFSLFTQAGQKAPVSHATGRISLHPFDSTSTILSRFRSLDRLMNPSRPDSIASLPSSSGLKGSAVYQAFRRVVNYADYYRGVESVFCVSTEATGRVFVPLSLSRESACDPILIDNFVQVAGVHVNCLADVPEDEVYVCSAVGEAFIGEVFMKRDPAAPQPWRVYSNYDRLSKGQVACDVFVMDQKSGQLAIAILAATFTSVSIRALTRTLAKLNNHQPSMLATNEPSAGHKEVNSILNVVDRPPPTAATVDTNKFPAIQAMLSDLLGVGLDELSPYSSLMAIGVDSLMSTEVLTEIKKRFGVNITSAELGEIPDIQCLVQAIFPGASVAQKQATTSKMPPLSDLAESVFNGPAPPDALMLAQKAYDLFGTTQANTDYSQITKWAGFCESVFPKQMALVTAYVVEAFRALGYPLELLHAGQAVPLIPVLPQHESVRNQLYEVLKFSKLICRKDDGMFRTAEAVPSDTSLLLHEDIIKEYPHHASEHTLLRTTGSRLAECLSGSADPLALLFQNADARRVMEDVYTNAPMFKSATMHLAQYLQDLVILLRSRRDIKILEIGAGTGGTTKYLVSQLAAVPGLRFEYTFTDISTSLVTLAKKKFNGYSCIQYATLNIEQDPPDDLLGQYDIVLSTNCIHATRNIAHSCDNIRKLLRPDGILCLIELTRNLFWFDLVFGLLEGWWLFNDGRNHALATEQFWNESLRQAGYNWVNWSCNDSRESEILRLIVASPTLPHGASQILFRSPLVTEETVKYDEKDGVQLLADIYYPSEVDDAHRRRPIALLIHGGGHVMLSRKDIRSQQIKMLLNSGFLPVSIDYRLCPETSLTEGPMRDVRDALVWTRRTLPRLSLKRPDIRPNGDQVVAVGWSTGGHLAMTLSWTASLCGVRAPEAILSFYCPTDYSDPFWSQPNFPYGRDIAPQMKCTIFGMQ